MQGGKLDGDYLKVLINSNATMAQFPHNALIGCGKFAKKEIRPLFIFQVTVMWRKKFDTTWIFRLVLGCTGTRVYGWWSICIADVAEVVSTLSIQNKAK